MLSVLIRVPPSHNHPLTELHPPPANQPCASLHQISINLQNRHKLKKIKLIKAVPVTYHERSLETKFQIAGSCPGLGTFPWFSTYWLHEHYVSGLHREKLEIDIDRRKIENRVELVCPWRSWGHWSLIWNISAYQHPFFCRRWRKYWKKHMHILRCPKKHIFSRKSDSCSMTSTQMYGAHYGYDVVFFTIIRRYRLYLGIFTETEHSYCNYIIIYTQKL